ncbi:MAG TPA: lipopolysaccharide heptosyltransferase II [Verrucomicrobiae bacterium]
MRSTNWLGDAVMATPALLRLREKFPDARITILTPEKLRELWTNHPAIDETISFAPNETVFAIAKKVRAGKFDLALTLPNSPRSAMEVFLAKIPNRIGYARPWRNFFLTQTVAPRAEAVKMQKLSVAEIQRRIATETQSAQRKKSGELCGLCDSVAKPETSAHQIHEYLHLTAALGANPEPLPPKLFVAPEEVEAAKKKFGLEKITQPIFGLNPGAEYGPAKRWPVEKFIAAAKEIQQQTNCIWILFGGKNDSEIANRIESAIRNSQFVIRNLCGKTSLRELMSLLKLCRALLTNDTGPMHVAAAHGVPVVAIFGSTSPELTGPVSSNGLRHQILKSNAPCSPCFLRECPIDFRCMNGIGVGQVVEAVLKTILTTDGPE